MNMSRWVDLDFNEEELDELEDEVEEGTGTEREVAVESEDNREVVNNLREEEEEDIVVDIEMEELQPLKAKQ